MERQEIMPGRGPGCRPGGSKRKLVRRRDYEQSLVEHTLNSNESEER